VHQKFSALFVGSEILQATRGTGSAWVVKEVPSQPEHPGLGAYPRADHQCHLHETLRMANIDYGRVDYAIVDDRVQVFEINTNPVIWPAELLLSIARALDEPRSAGSIPVSATYTPAWRATTTPSYYAGRVIHRALRWVGMMRYEDVVVRRLRRLKRRLDYSAGRPDARREPQDGGRPPR
jgi:hypothetical protein